MGSFNPPGGFGAFGTRDGIKAVLKRYPGFNPPGGFGAFGTKLFFPLVTKGVRFNPPGGFGAFGTYRWCGR